MIFKNDYTEENLKCQGKKSSLEKEHLTTAKEKKLLHKVFYEFMRELQEMGEISLSKLSSVKECGNLIKFLSNADKTIFSLQGGSFCNDRMCPICSWRLARKTAVILLQLLEYARVKLDKEFIFLTLTAKNVQAEDLGQEITDYNRSFERLAQTKAFKKINLGYIRKLEITYNEKENTYHPHFHIIIAVNKSYFKKSDYISKKEWLEMWKKAKRDSTITQVDIRKVKMNSIKEVFEIATYSTKQKQLYSSFEVFSILREVFKNRRIISYNGLFRELKKMRDEGNLILDDLDNLKTLEEVADREIYYLWVKIAKDYTEYAEKILTEDDFKKIYNLDFEELEND